MYKERRNPIYPPERERYTILLTWEVVSLANGVGVGVGEVDFEITLSGAVKAEGDREHGGTVGAQGPVRDD